LENSLSFPLGGIVADPTSLQRRINQEQLANYYGQKGSGHAKKNQKGGILFKPPSGENLHESLSLLF
jgi:hypothetical protein